MAARAACISLRAMLIEGDRYETLAIWRNFAIASAASKEALAEKPSDRSMIWRPHPRGEAASRARVVKRHAEGNWAVHLYDKRYPLMAV